MKTNLCCAAVFLLVCCSCNNATESAVPQPTINAVKVDSLINLSAVTDIKKLLCQNWENKEDAEDAAFSGGGEGLEMPYRGISFFADASVVENPRDKIRFGTWILDETNKTVKVEFMRGGTTNYKIEEISPVKMVLMNLADKTKMEYRADARVAKTPADDPFHISNNQWRIKPLKPEADSAIQQRAEQCVLFYAKYLVDNGNRGGRLPFTGLPTCFKWYRGGVSVTTSAKLDPKWLNCFYNKEQALKAHAMLESIISRKYKWDKEEKNWLIQTGGVVRQMYDTLQLL